MSKRTNKIFNVRVVQYAWKSAWMAVEADSPSEAMELAKKYTDEYITEKDFEYSKVDVNACESYPSEIDDYEDKDRIFTADGVKSVKEYENELNAQE